MHSLSTRAASFTRMCGRFVKFMRMLAGVYTKHDPQSSNPNQVMVIMFSAELGAVDEPHRHLKSFMEGRRLL
jgi:hypothetical protein